MRVRHYVYLAVTALVITALAAVFSMSAQAQTATRAFYGPFPSWRQVKCEGADDTAMLQNELNVLGNPGHSPVLYINPGTCRLTATLHIDQEHGGCRYGGVSILGADPATTKMLWAGPSDINQPMLSWGCMFDSRFGRLTWDGGGRAVTVYWQSQLPEYSSTNRHEDEFFVNLDPNGVAIRSGGQGVGDAEVEYLREHFIGPMQAGMLLYDYNSVDHWVHNSEFIGPMEAGVANFVSTQNGAGNFGIDHSNFINVTADAQLANPGFFTTTGNYSRGNHWHVHALASGSAAATWTSLSETIIDPDPTQSQFEFGNPGPLFVGDLHLRSSRDREGISRVVEGYTGNPGGDTSSIGNTSSASGGGQYNVPIPGLGRDFTNSGELYGLDDHPGQSISDPGPYTIMTPSRSTLPVIEVQNGDIASALSQAGSQHVIVHVPFGQYVPSSSLNVGPNVVLVGDGSSTGGSDITAGTGVDPVLHLPGPSHAVVAELGVNSTQGGSKQGTDVLIDHADQPSGLVHIEMPSGSDNHRGLDAENLSSTIVQLQDGGISGGNQAMNDPGPNVDYYVANATVRQFMGASTASDALYEMHGGTLVVQQRFYQGADNGQVTPPDSMVIPGSSGILVLDEGNFASGQGNINLTSFSGPVTAIGIGETTNCNTGKSAAFGADTLLLGYLFGWSDTGAPPSCTTPPSALAPSLLWQLRHSNGGGTDLTNSADQNLGVSDTARFVRDHLMPLRAARPLSPGGRAAGTTDVQLIRLGISGSLAGVKVVGNANPAPTARHPARI